MRIDRKTSLSSAARLLWAPGFITMAITDDATSQEPGTERFEDWKKYSAFYGTMSVRTISLQELSSSTLAGISRWSASTSKVNLWIC